MLFDFADGKLSPVHQALVAAHVAICDECPPVIQQAKIALGEALDALPPAPVAADAFERFMATRANRKSGPTATPTVLDWKDEGLRWFWPGMRGRTLIRQGKDELQLMHGAPGAVLPRRSHEGRDTLLVAAGSFVLQGQEYVTGDLIEDYQFQGWGPAVMSGHGCYYFLATTGGAVRPLGLLPWLKLLLGCPVPAIFTLKPRP